jgi:hypothetical protein
LNSIKWKLENRKGFKLGWGLNPAQGSRLPALKACSSG